MAKLLLPALLAFLATSPLSSPAAEPSQSCHDCHKIAADVLADKIRGGLLGQLFGNLNGLPHEMKYIDAPGNVTEYVPSLPEGARTDDDTDLEWVYIVAMERSGESFLAPDEITRLWKAHINDRIWCADEYARALMDLDLAPPLTGSSVLNPWSEFNLSGQFVCETFALTAPGMPQTASRLALHYTRVAIDGEPAQTTQFFATMIAAAFLTDRIDKLLDAGVKALDPQSKVRPIVADVRAWHAAHPDDWRATRRLLHDKYSCCGGAMRDRNGYELNTGSTVAALLYGQGDLATTLRHAFNFGWDADNNAATVGTILGVIRGGRWIDAQGWTVLDRYRNTTRPGMPDDETITRFATRITNIAFRNISEASKKPPETLGQVPVPLPAEHPANVQPLTTLNLMPSLQPLIDEGLAPSPPAQAQARAAYLAVCFDLADDLQRDRPADWARARNALERNPAILELLSKSPAPAAAELRQRMRAAGLTQ